MKGYLRK